MIKFISSRFDQSSNPENITTGFATIEIDGERREVRAFFNYRDGEIESIHVYDLAVRIGRTGTKRHPAMMIYWPKSERFNTLRAVHYDRLNNRGVSLLGFF